MSDRSRGSSVHERIVAAARQLAREKPPDRIGLSEIARTAGVSWPTVKRHLGSQEELRELLASEAGALPDTRSRLLDAAIRVVARAGSGRATLDDIATEAGMTKGAVYWHFDSKHALLLAVLDELARRRRAGVPAVVEGQDTASALASLLRSAVADDDWARILFDFAATGSEVAIRERLVGVLSEGERAFADAVRTLQQQGRVVAQHDPDDVAAVLQALSSGLRLARLVDPDRASGLVDAIVRLVEVELAAGGR